MLYVHPISCMVSFNLKDNLPVNLICMCASKNALDNYTPKHAANQPNSLLVKRFYQLTREQPAKKLTNKLTNLPTSNLVQ